MRRELKRTLNELELRQRLQWDLQPQNQPLEFPNSGIYPLHNRKFRQIPNGTYSLAKMLDPDGDYQLQGQLEGPKRPNYDPKKLDYGPKPSSGLILR